MTPRTKALIFAILTVPALYFAWVIYARVFHGQFSWRALIILVIVAVVVIPTMSVLDRVMKSTLLAQAWRLGWRAGSALRRR